MVKEYFARKATRYDEVDLQPYWVFSDALLWELLLRRMLPVNRSSSFHLVDAGGGTARWTSKILSHYPNASADVVDFSPDMLSVARSKLERLGLADRTRLLEADLADLPTVVERPATYVLCLHNVLGFVPDLQRTLRGIYEVLAPDGTAALMFPSRYHALYFSLANGRMGEVDRILQTGAVRFTEDMPDLRVFDLGQIEQQSTRAGLSLKSVLGFPVTLYPGMEETTIDGNTASLAVLLGDGERRNWMLEFELEMCQDSRLAARGNNLLVLTQRNGS